MKYAIIRCTDTNFAVHGEYHTLQGAKVAFHQLCAALWNDPGTKNATVKIVDEQLDNVEGYRDFIHRETEQTE